MRPSLDIIKAVNKTESGERKRATERGERAAETAAGGRGRPGQPGGAGTAEAEGGPAERGSQRSCRHGQPEEKSPR